MHIAWKSISSSLALVLARAVATAAAPSAGAEAVPNGGQYAAGANSVVWRNSGGSTSTSEVVSSIEGSASGLKVSAVFVLSGNGWAYYLPRFPSAGSLRSVGSLTSMIVILDSGAAPASAPASSGDLSSSVAQGINAARGSRGLSSLSPNGQLTSAAAGYASFLASYGYPYRGAGSPHSLDGEPWDRVVRAGHSYRSVGEVVMWSVVPGAANVQTEAQRAVDGWLNSPPHRDIILGSYADLGVGCTQGPDTGPGGRGASYTRTICVGVTGTPR